MVYQKQGHILGPVFKFLMTLTILCIVNGSIGYDSRMKSIPVVALFSLLGAFTPFAVTVVIVAFVSLVHIFYVSKVLAAITVVIMMILYLLLVRFASKESYVVLVLPILFILKIPYVVPILLGMISTPVSVIPMVCGVIIYYLFHVVKAVAGEPSNANIEETLQFYKLVMDTLLGNKEMLFTIVIFALVILVTYLIRRQTFDHAFDIAIIGGVVTNLLAMLILSIQVDMSVHILTMILGTIVSGGIVYLIQFFKLNLDYSRIENVQFEDDDYYYYVKAVPKINVTAPEVNVKHINPRKGSGTPIPPSRDFEEDDIKFVDDERMD